MKRIIKISSVLLAVCMLIALLPAGVYASSDAWDGTSIDVTWYNTTDTKFTITTPAQLAGLAAIVNGTANGIAKDSFAGKTVNLGADIDLNNYNWTSIGCRTGDADFYYAGVFNGNSHMIINLSISYDITGQLMPNGTARTKKIGYVGLFGYVEGTADNRAIIKNITLKGTITLISETLNSISSSPAGFGGLIGYAVNTDISDCIVDVDVTDNSNTDKNIQYIGGIVGWGYTLRIERCVNLGDITCNAPRDRYIGGLVGGLQNPPYTIVDCCNRGNVSVSPSVNTNYGGYVGGLIGYLSLGSRQNVDVSYICNCYNTGSVIGSPSGVTQRYTGALIAVVINNGAAICADIISSNNYYLDLSCSNVIGDNNTSVEIASIAKASDNMMSPEFVALLNINDVWMLGITYPILNCQPNDILQGDISRSGIVDENDVTYLIGHVLRTDILAPNLAVIGDMDYNSLIDENDITYLIQKVIMTNQ